MATDVVCVLNAALAQVFANARPIKAAIKVESKMMEHPLETGATVSDHRIILPIEIELSMVLPGADYAATYRQIRDLFQSGEMLTVQTRTDSYQNMSITAMPHEETPDAMDAINMGLCLKEVLYVSPQFSDLIVARPPDARTKQRGEQQGAPSKKQSSILSGLFK